MKPICIFLFLLASFYMAGQNHAPSAAGAKGLGMGNVRTISTDATSLFGNQAGLAHLTEMNAFVFGENRFLLPDVNQFSAGFALPTSSGSFGLALQYFGFEGYNEQKIGLAYARKLTKKLLIGVQMDYLNLRIPEYGNSGKVTFEIGVQAQISEKLMIGTHIFSPITINWNETDIVPTVFAIGGRYEPSKKLTLSAEVEKDFEYPLNAKFGLDYQIIEPLSLRIGLNTFPIQNSFGIGLHLKKMTIDIASVFHPTLGVSSGISISRTF